MVAFPTETVYGIGADATNERAITALFEAKRRPSHNPLIVHVADPGEANRLVHFDELSHRLARAFWPGPLTLVLPRIAGSGISRLVSAGRDSLAVRIPAHPLASELIKAAGIPIAAPSANMSSRVSPTTADHVVSDLEGRIHAVIDGGPCRFGLESTVIRSTGSGLELLRPGALTEELIVERLGIQILSNRNPADIVSPGQLPVHYSPESRIRMNASSPEDGEILIGFGPDTEHNAFNLSHAANMEEAAASLYGLLRSADQQAVRSGATAIAVAPIPGTGLGKAINDRLKRACGQDSGGSTS